MVFENFRFVFKRTRFLFIDEFFFVFCFQLLVDDLIVWTGLLEINDKQNESGAKFNTILFSDEKILRDDEKRTIVENKPSTEHSNESISSRDQAVDFCQFDFKKAEKTE